MTKRDRAQVAELLKCAADIAATGKWGFMGIASDAATFVAHSKRIDDLATKVATEVAGGAEAGKNTDEFIETMLEAAARVEEGSWP